MVVKFPTLEDAIILAVIAHKNQKDKQGVTYVRHCLRVMEAVAKLGEEAMMIAILHDTVEDTTLTLDDLRHVGFSELVISGVDAITKRPKEVETHAQYIERVKMHSIARQVKLADIADNLNRMTPDLESMRPRYEKARRVLEAE